VVRCRCTVSLNSKLFPSHRSLPHKKRLYIPMSEGQRTATVESSLTNKPGSPPNPLLYLGHLPSSQFHSPAPPPQPAQARPIPPHQPALLAPRRPARTTLRTSMPRQVGCSPWLWALLACCKHSMSYSSGLFISGFHRADVIGPTVRDALGSSVCLVQRRARYAVVFNIIFIWEGSFLVPILHSSSAPADRARTSTASGFRS
jgi:hypothetical protein